MIALIISLLYAAMGVTIAMRVATVLAWRHFRSAKASYPHMFRYNTEPTGAQWFGGYLCGLCVGTLWPFFLPGLLTRKWVFAPPEDPRLKQEARRTIDKLEEWMRQQ